MGLAALGLGAALVLLARVTSPGEPTPIAFHDLSAATTGSWQQSPVAEAPTPIRAPEAGTVAPAKTEREAAFLSWRGAFLEDLAAASFYCGMPVEVSCNGAACVVRVEESKAAWLRGVARRPRRLLEAFLAGPMGMPSEIDRCATHQQGLMDNSSMSLIRSGDRPCFGLYPQVRAVPPPSGPKIVAGKCVNCPPIDNPGPAATEALCECLATQPLRTQ